MNDSRSSIVLKLLIHKQAAEILESLDQYDDKYFFLAIEHYLLIERCLNVIGFPRSVDGSVRIPIKSMSDLDEVVEFVHSSE